jgi:Stress responsive A/B Barrel Domain
MAGLTIGLVSGVGSSMANNKEEPRVLRHVVMFKFKEASSKEDVAKVVEAFKALPSKIPSIASFECGTNNSPEGLADGFTHCFLVTFKSEKDRAEYLPHAAHAAFVEVLKPHMDKALVLDYWNDGK